METVVYNENLMPEKADNNVTCKVGDLEFVVRTYLPVGEKYNLIKSTIATSTEENGTISPVKLDFAFHLLIVESYTNLEFSDEEMADIVTLYDTLEQSGIIDTVIQAIPAKEYDTLFGYLTATVDTTTEYNKSIARFISDLPKAAEAAMKIVEGFDPEKFANVVEFAKAANNNKPILD